MVFLVFIAMLLFGSVIGWLVVYFVRKYKEHGPKVLWDTALLFLGGVGLDSLLFFMDKRLSLVALMAYIIGVAVSFFAHWIYQFMVAKSMAPKFMDARSKYDLFAGCNLSEDYKDRTLLEYNLECVSQGICSVE